MKDCRHDWVYGTGRELDEIIHRFFEGGVCIDCKEKIVLTETRYECSEYRIAVTQDDLRIGPLYRRRDHT